MVYQSFVVYERRGWRPVNVAFAFAPFSGVFEAAVEA